MWHKRHRPEDVEAPAGQRLRQNLTDLFASGDVAGSRAQSLLNDAGEFADSLGSHEMQDLRGSRGQGSSKNQARDLQRRLLRRSHWPPLYLQEVRCWSLKEKMEVRQKVAMLLPHEILHVLASVGDEAVLCQSGGLDGWNQQKHREILQSIQSPFVSVSLWGDGVPFSWDRKNSADIWTMSLPGLECKQYRDIRICITSMPHQRVLKSTQDDIMAILAWSFKALALGRFPDQRADGEEWAREDSWRRERAGQDMIKGAVIEIKGDWKQLYQVFALPSWMRRQDKPICWRCLATKDQDLSDLH